MITTASLALLFALQSGLVSAEEQKAAVPEQKAAQTEQKAAAPTDPVAKVNGVAITNKDVDRAVKVLLSQNRVPQPTPPEIMKQAQSAATDQLISAELLFQAGQKLEIKDLDKQIVDKIAQNKAKFPTVEEFEKAMKSLEMGEKDMEEFTRKDIVINNLIEKNILSKITVPDADVKKFYDDNLEKYFKKQESVKASHILIGVDEKATPEDRKKAKEKIEAILKKVKAGEDFAALAKTESTCPSKAQGGDLGVFTRGQMVAPFEKAAFDLKPGEVSDIVETQFGYHIIKLTEKNAAATEKFDDVKAKIADYLKSQQAQKAVATYVEELKAKAKIEKP
jgi:peptidyl-prolyl cis-trans isomerase C